MIKELRTSIGLTQADLAERLRVSQSTITHWETGKRLPSPTLARALVRLLHSYGHPVTLDDIYGDAPAPEDEDAA